MTASIERQHPPLVIENSFMQRMVLERQTNHHAELLKEANNNMAKNLVGIIDDIEFESVASYGKKCLKPFERKWFKICFYVLLVKVRIVFENTVLAIGIGHLFEPAQNSFDAEAKASRFRELLSSDSPYKVFFTLFMLYMIEAKAYKWSKRLTICILVSSVVYPYFKPVPFEFYGIKNWSTDYNLGRQQIYGASEHILNEMAEALNSKDKLGPILVGPPGIGKTEMARAFAAKVAENKYAGLKGKTVFYVNTANFAHQTGVLHFKWMISQLDPFKDRILFVFDEVHTAIESPVSDAMKTELEGVQAIFITTDKDINKVEEDAAFMARLERIDIKPPQDEDRQEAIADIMRIEAPKSWVAEGAIDHLEAKLSELTSDLKRKVGFRCEEDPIFEVLRKCVALLAKEKKSPLEKELESKKSSLGTQKNLLGSKSFKRAPIETRIQELRSEISSLQERVGKEKEGYTTFLSLVNRLFEEKKVLYRLAVKGKSSCSEKERSLFNLINSTYIPDMEKYLLTKASELQVDVAITSDLIERVFENFKKKIPKEELV